MSARKSFLRRNACAAPPMSIGKSPRASRRRFRRSGCRRCTLMVCRPPLRRTAIAPDRARRTARAVHHRAIEPGSQDCISAWRRETFDVSSQENSKPCLSQGRRQRQSRRWRSNSRKKPAAASSSTPIPCRCIATCGSSRARRRLQNSKKVPHRLYACRCRGKLLRGAAGWRCGFGACRSACAKSLPISPAAPACISRR